MPRNRHLAFIVFAVVAGFIAHGCGSGSPTAPSVAERAPLALQAGDGPAQASNEPPNLKFNTTPPQPVDGPLPLAVAVNMCQSRDPDPGDSLRFDVDWGDGVFTGVDQNGAGTSIEDGGPPDGCDGPGCCRHRHTFTSENTFTVTLSVTDKHLEDQGGDIAALARTTATFLVFAGQNAPPGAPGSGTVPGVTTRRFDTGDLGAGAPAAGGGQNRINKFLTVDGVPGAISDVDVDLHIESSFVGDNDIEVIGPDGTKVELSSDNGFADDDYGTSCASRTRFDDDAGTSITAGAAPFVGTFAPESPLAAFNNKRGDQINGVWNLFVIDPVLGDVPDAILRCWAVEITT